MKAVVGGAVLGALLGYALGVSAAAPPSEAGRSEAHPGPAPQQDDAEAWAEDRVQVLEARVAELEAAQRRRCGPR